MKFLIYIFMLMISSICLGQNLPIQSLKLPPGFSISVYAYPVEGARQMALGPNNIIFVGSIKAGKVYAIVPDDHAPSSPHIFTIISGLNMPNGVAFYDNNLYVADVNRILRFDDIVKHLPHPPNPIEITHSLPSEAHHGWRYIRFGPDNKLYIGIGAPCNVCLNDDPRFATIMRMNVDGTNQEIFAKGIRNTVGFDWDPVKHELWFTDNGRDWMGDNLPPDELNYAPTMNLNFGFPYCHGKNIPDPEYGKKYPCSSFVAPQLELPAHVAALGMIFYTGNMFPSEYHNAIFIAEHGSWNRSSKIGYQVITVMQQGNTYLAKPFITGWLQNNNVLGRPVDLLQLPDGSVLISDDFANVIYRVTYKK